MWGMTMTRGAVRFSGCAVRGIEVGTDAGCSRAEPKRIGVLSLKARVQNRRCQRGIRYSGSCILQGVRNGNVVAVRQVI